MKLSSSLEAASCSAIQELPNILSNPKVHYCVQKNLGFRFLNLRCSIQ
jgi:hypothetical protein